MKYYYSLVLLFVCSLTLLSQKKATLIDKIVAKVDDQIVLESEVEKGYNEFISTGKFFGSNVRCKVLEALVVNRLLLAKAETDSVTVEPSRVEGELDRRIQYVLQGRDPKILEQQYGKTMNSIKDELRDQIRDEMIIQQMRQEITNTTAITPSEVKKFYKELPKDSLPYFSSEVQVGQIVIYPTINKQEKTRVKARLEELKKKIQNGESFAEMARRYSEDPGSGKAGGELGFFNRGDLVPEYEAAALGLEAGEISKIVESQFGFHLIQMIERRGNRYNSRHILLKPSSSSQDLNETALTLDSLRSKILSDSVSFEKVATKNSVDPITSSSGGFFTDRATGSVRVTTQNLDPGLFFILDTMRVGTISRPIKHVTADGKKAMRIVYYKAKTPPHEANLKDDYQKIQKAAVDSKKAEKLNNWFNESKQEIYLYIDDKYKACKIFQ